MSSRSIFKTQQDLIKFIENDNETKSYLQKQIDPYKSYPMVLLTGMMGVGKSSISCCLSGKKLIVEISGRRKYLVGEGVGVGLNACTTLPSFLFNSKHRILFVDLPGFEDNRTTEQEISNAFAHNHIYDLFPNHRKQYKIVLVISSYDFDATKCTKLIESFARLKKMFPRYNDIKHSFGVIITKGENAFTSNDYIDFFNEKYNQTPNPSPEMNEVHRFLNTYKNNVFVFPQPTNNLIGNQYNFNDHNRLLNFLQNNYCVNPQHQIAICTNAELNLLASYKSCLDNVIKDANGILNKIKKQFSIETNLVKLKRWYDFIGKILSAHIETAKDLNCIIKDNIPDGLNYDNDFKNLYDSIIFDDLISKILPTQRNTSYLNDTIKQWCQYSKDDLLIKIENAEEKEIIEQKRKEKEKREREAQRLAEKIKREEQEMKDREQKRKREIDEKERKEQEMKEKIKQAQMKIQRLSGG